MLELHIWGPAFRLPSIDAECLATIHYLQSVLPDNTWRINPSNNPNISPFERLPALRDNSAWVAGFDQIQQYLSERSNGEWDLDGDLNETQKADCDAYTSFLRSRGLPLTDLSLYVSSENYTTCTRRALGDLLSWPQSWTVPHQLRDRAKRRSDHLGLSALDVDTAQEGENKDVGLAAQIPKSLRKPKQTVSGLLGRGVQQTRFRLDAVTEDFLEPLAAKLDRAPWLVADKKCSVDCFAIAIINIMQLRDLPQAWLSEALSSKYPSLDMWAENHASDAYGQIPTFEMIERGDLKGTKLPWQTPTSVSWKEASMLAMETVVSSLPILRAGYDHLEICESKEASAERIDDRTRKQRVYAQRRSQQRVYSTVVAASISTVSLVGWMIHAGVLSWSRSWMGTSNKKSFGEAGAILGLL